MAIICPNFNNPDVAREFEELRLAIGEKAAYAVWSLNNGNSIEMDPNGGPSRLFQDLLNAGYTRELAIQIKASMFQSNVLSTYNWTETGIEPSMSDALAMYDPASNEDYINAAEEHAVDEIENNAYVVSRLESEYNEWSIVNPGGDRRTFYKLKLEQAKVQIVNSMCKLFGMKKDSRGRFVPRMSLIHKRTTTERLQIDMLRSIDEMFSNPLYSSFMVHVLTSMINGSNVDASTNVRLIAEIYLNMFSSSEPVQSLVHMWTEYNKDMSTNDIYRHIVDDIYNEVQGKRGNYISRFFTFIQDQIMMFRKHHLTNKSVIRQLTRSLATAMASNTMITKSYADEIVAPLKKYSNFISLDDYTTNKNVIDSLIMLNRARLDRIKLYPEMYHDEIKDLKERITQLKRVNVDQLNEVDSAILSFVSSSYADIGSALQFIDDCLNTDPSQIDRKKLTSIKENVLKGLNRTINNTILPYMARLNNNPMYSIGGAIYNEIQLILSDITKAKIDYELVDSKWADWHIDDFIDQEPTQFLETIPLEDSESGTSMSAKDKLKKNAKLALHNKIRYTGMSRWFAKPLRWFGNQLSLGSTMNYASASKSIVVRIVDKMIRNCDLNVRKAVSDRQKLLTFLYKRSLNLGRKLSFKNQLSKFMEKFDDGSYTGNFLTRVRVGQYMKEEAAQKKHVIDHYLTPICDLIKYIKDHIDSIDQFGNSTIPEVQGAIDYVAATLNMFNSNIADYVRESSASFTYNEKSHIFDTDDVYLQRLYDDYMDMWKGGFDPETGEQGPIRKHRRFHWQYYYNRRRFLSADTEKEYDALSDAIDALKEKCFDEDLLFCNPLKLSKADRAKLYDLLNELEQMSCPYAIQLDATGRVNNVIEKTGDAKRKADELKAWTEFKNQYVERVQDPAAYSEVHEKIRLKFGDNSAELLYFEQQNYFPDSKVDDWVTLLFPQNDPRLKDLYQRRSLILGQTKLNHYGIEQPNLDKLSDSAWAELRRIEEEIFLITQGMPIPMDDETKQKLEGLSTMEEVINPATGLSFMFDYRRRYANNMNEYYDKFYYVQRDTNGNPIGLLQLPAFYYRRYAKSAVHDTFSLPFQLLDKNSAWVDEDYVEDDEFNNIDSELYKNEEYYDMIDNDNDRELYEALVETMLMGWEALPKNRLHYKYQLPQIMQSNMRSKWLLKRPSDGRSAIKLWWEEDWQGVSTELDDDLTEQFSTNANGDRIHVVPIKYVKPLGEDAWAIESNIIESVLKFYEMALNFKNKSDIEDAVDALESVIGGGFNGSPDSYAEAQRQRIHDHALAYIYGKKTRGFKASETELSGFEKFLWKITRRLNGYTAKAFLNLNIKNALKNGGDSLFAFLMDIINSFHFGPRVAAQGFKDLVKDIGYMFGNPNSTNSKSFYSACVQYNGLHQNPTDTASGVNKYKVRSFFSKFIELGIVQSIDYSTKAFLAAMTYRDYRLVPHPITGEMVFVNKRQAMLMYNNVNGFLKSHGKDIWKKSKTYLKDAYYVDGIGRFRIKDEFKDIIRPLRVSQDRVDEKLRLIIASVGVENGILNLSYDPDNRNDDLDQEITRRFEEWKDKHRSNNFEATIASRMQERASVLNGMFSDYSKARGSMTLLGSMFLLMRGWSVSQGVDHFKSGEDFMDFVPQNTSPGQVNTNQVLVARKSADKLMRELANCQYSFASGMPVKGDFNGGMCTQIAKIIGSPIKGTKEVFKGLINYCKRMFLSISNLASNIASSGHGKHNPTSFTNNFTEHEKLLLRRHISWACVIFLNIALSFITGHWVENADKGDNQLNKWGANIVYATQSGVQSELLSKAGPLGYAVALYNFAQQPFTSTGYVADLVEVAGAGTHAVGYFADEAFGTDWNDVDFNATETRSSYKGLTVGEKYALKANLVLPVVNTVNVNNFVQSIRIPALKASQGMSAKQTNLPLVPGKLSGLFRLYTPNTNGDGKQLGFVPQLFYPNPESTTTGGKSGGKKKSGGSSAKNSSSRGGSERGGTRSSGTRSSATRSSGTR